MIPATEVETIAEGDNRAEKKGINEDRPHPEDNVPTAEEINEFLARQGGDGPNHVIVDGVDLQSAHDAIRSAWSYRVPLTQPDPTEYSDYFTTEDDPTAVFVETEVGDIHGEYVNSTNMRNNTMHWYHLIKDSGEPDFFESLEEELAVIEKEKLMLDRFIEIDLEARLANERIQQGIYNPHDFAKVLAAWSFANERAKAMEQNPVMFDDLWEYWNRVDAKFSLTLGNFRPPLPVYDGIHYTPNRIENSSPNYILELLADSEFESPGVAAHYLTTEVIDALNRSRFNTPNHQEDTSYQEYKSTILSAIHSALPQIASENDRTSIRRIFQNLNIMGEVETARSYLLREDITSNERIALTAEHMNVFGIVETLRFLAEAQESSPHAGELYKAFQGEDVDRIMTGLGQIYGEIDFHQYAINSEKLTNYESAIIKNVVALAAENMGIRAEDILVVDVGAGTGRHAVILHNDGYRVIAFDYEQHHVEKIKEQAPNMVASIADWHNLPLRDGSQEVEETDEESADIAYILGRSIMHNNTVGAMMKGFDELTRTVKDDGYIVVDLPIVPNNRDPENAHDQYTQDIEHFAKNLEAKGVNGFNARHIFDGPDSEHKFNRMAITPAQVESYAKLFGLKIVNTESTQIEGENIVNGYYTFQKDPNFNIGEIPANELEHLLTEIGAFDSGMDLYTYMSRWSYLTGAVLSESQIRHYQSNLTHLDGTHPKMRDEKTPVYQFEYIDDKAYVTDHSRFTFNHFSY